MPIAILMPALSPTMKEGHLVKWYKKEGDTIEAGDVLADIETDKATMEVEAVDEGLLKKIMIAEGTENVAVNSTIAVLKEEDDSDEDFDSFVKNLGSGTSVSEQKPEEADQGQSVTPETETPATHRSTNQTLSESIPQASPLARRMMQSAGIDASQVQGTGPKGRIIKKDVEAYVSATPSSNTASRKQPLSASNSVQIPATAMPLTETLAAEGFSGFEPPCQNQSISSVRKVIAQRLQQSKQLAPHFYVSVDARLDTLADLRQKMQDAGRPKLSINDFILKAVSLALTEHPACNSAWSSEGIRLYERVDLAVAVSVDGGLITPVIRNAAQKNLTQLSSEMKQLAAKARDGTLKPQEFQGGTFTVSNMGMFGVKHFSAIINPPQSGILAVGGLQEEPVLEGKRLVVQKKMTLTLSVDHRLIDGVLAATFLNQIKAFLEEPALMLTA